MYPVPDLLNFAIIDILMEKKPSFWDTNLSNCIISQSKFLNQRRNQPKIRGNQELFILRQQLDHVNGRIETTQRHQAKRDSCAISL